MPGAGLFNGLNIKKPPEDRTKLHRPRAFFDEDEDHDDESKGEGVEIQEIREVKELDSKTPFLVAPDTRVSSPFKGTRRHVNGGSKVSLCTYGDLSTSFTSKKHADAAKDLDENIYDYDSVYDSLKPQKKIKDEKDVQKPRYMSNLLEAAAIRKRDAAIAEEKKLAREREAEGDEYADKEKFVTSAYKKKQEENRRLEEEERIREEQESKKNKNTGMINFYKNMLEKGEQKHAQIVKAVDERIKNGPTTDEEPVRAKTAAELAREINEKKAGAIVVNDEGDVVDKRQLLAGGLNIISKQKPVASVDLNRGKQTPAHNRGSGIVGVGGGKQAMRERQSRMIEAQLEQTTKRALEIEKEETERIEKASKSRKTEPEIMSAKERYLARKREAEEAKKKSE